MESRRAFSGGGTVLNETRIALAFVVLGVALLVGTLAYLAYDRDDGTRSAGAHDARSTTTAAAPGGQEPPRSGAETGTDGPAAGDDPRSVPPERAESVPTEGSPPSAGRETTPPQPSAPVPTEADPSSARGEVPAYASLRESRADGVTEVVVGAEVTAEDEMRLVASDLASDYPGEGVLLVEFREGANGGPSSGRETGFALVFGSREAAMAPDLEYTPQQVDELFEQDGGIRAVSYEELGEENPSLQDDLERIRTS